MYILRAGYRRLASTNFWNSPRVSYPVELCRSRKESTDEARSRAAVGDSKARNWSRALRVIVRWWPARTDSYRLYMSEHFSVRIYRTTSVLPSCSAISQNSSASRFSLIINNRSPVKFMSRINIIMYRYRSAGPVSSGHALSAHIASHHGIRANHDTATPEVGARRETILVGNTGSEEWRRHWWACHTSPHPRRSVSIHHNRSTRPTQRLDTRLTDRRSSR